jgi:nucleotide-binding universal stress UspA family protein
MTPVKGSAERDSVVISVEMGPALGPLLTAAWPVVTAFKGKIHIVNAQPPPLRFCRPWVRTAHLESERSAAGVAMDRACRMAGIEASRAVFHVRSETRVRATLEAVRLADPAAIILGSLDMEGSRFGNTLRFLKKLISKTSLPTVILRRAHERPPRRIVVATDFSPHADRALDLATRWASFWAAEAGAGESSGKPVEVELLHISDFASPGRRALSSQEALEKRISAQESQGPPLVLFSGRTLSAPLATDGIQAAAEASAPDLLFLGTRGTGPVSRAVFGSVAQEVLRRITSSVVVVPLPR